MGSIPQKRLMPCAPGIFISADYSPGHMEVYLVFRTFMLMRNVPCFARHNSYFWGSAPRPASTSVGSASSETFCCLCCRYNHGGDTTNQIRLALITNVFSLQRTPYRRYTHTNRLFCQTPYRNEGVPPCKHRLAVLSSRS